MKITEVVRNSRADFESTWLTEMPEGIGSFELADTVAYGIKDRIKHGSVPVNLGNGLMKIEGVQTVYYWYEKNGNILLAIEFTKGPQALIVNAVGKFNKGRPPFATDLYDAVLADRKNIAGSVNSIRLMSDRQLSDDGIKIWQRLLAQGHKISVYNNKEPGQSFIEITSEEELLQYCQDDNINFQQWQYVISESASYAETRSFFNTRRMRELNPKML
jgi:hypothetical protein